MMCLAELSLGMWKQCERSWAILPLELPGLLSLWFHCKYLLQSWNVLLWLYVHKLSSISMVILWV